MNKKVNTVLFMLVATIVNIVILGLLIVGLFVAYVAIAGKVNLDQSLQTIFIVLIFAISIFGTYFFYNLIIKAFTSKVDMDKYFDPIFKRRKR